MPDCINDIPLQSCLLRTGLQRTTLTVPPANGRSALAPEVELLLCCAQSCVDSARAGRISSLARADIDWTHLFQLAGPHGILPLVYRSLSTTCPQVVPKATLDLLRDHSCTIAGHNFFLTGELLKLLHLFEEHRIAAVPFKGPVLAASAYGSVVLREFCDLDILVHKRDVPRGREVLLSQGYEQVDSTGDADKYSHTFVRDKGIAVVDLHWGIAERHFCFTLNPERLWERLVATCLAGTTVPTFSPEDTLLMLCMHGAKHRWDRLGWICDIAELTRVHQRMDWTQLIEYSAKLGSQRMLFLGLFLATNLLGAQLPNHVYRSIRADPAVTLLAANVREWIFHGIDSAAQAVERDSFYLTMRERWRDRAQYFLRLLPRLMIPNSQDRELLPLPKSLSLFYWLLRPIRLVVTYGNPLVLLKRLVGLL